MKKKYLIITPELFDFIREKCAEYQSHSQQAVEVGDIIYSYLNPGFILKDWKEGLILNKVSAIVFIDKMVDELIRKCSESHRL